MPSSHLQPLALVSADHHKFGCVQDQAACMCAYIARPVVLGDLHPTKNRSCLVAIFYIPASVLAVGNGIRSMTEYQVCLPPSLIP